MSLSIYEVRPSIAVSNLATACVRVLRRSGPEADEKGIHELDDGRVAWFRDPDGNTFAVEQESRP